MQIPASTGEWSARQAQQTNWRVHILYAASGAASAQPLTMSTREIAALTGKRHDHVIRDTRAMLDELRDAPDLGNVREEKDARGYTACFHLPKDLTLTLLAGYSVTLRHRIVTRLREREMCCLRDE